MQRTPVQPTEAVIAGHTVETPEVGPSCTPVTQMVEMQTQEATQEKALEEEELVATKGYQRKSPITSQKAGLTRSQEKVEEEANGNSKNSSQAGAEGRATPSQRKGQYQSKGQSKSNMHKPTKHSKDMQVELDDCSESTSSDPKSDDDDETWGAKRKAPARKRTNLTPGSSLKKKGFKDRDDWLSFHSTDAIAKNKKGRKCKKT